jgi:AcrR family transcriptional regulator
MGHREQLLDGARRCLEDRGYGRTTARDLVAASGTNLASIGYHFGSKEALLNEAIVAAFAEHTERLLALASPEAAAEDPLAGTRASWIAMVEEFARMRPLLVAFIEAMAQAERTPALRAQLAEGYERLRATIAVSVKAQVPELPDDCARAIASFMVVVSDGLMIQWLLDPGNVPNGAVLFDAVELMFSRAR